MPQQQRGGRGPPLTKQAHRTPQPHPPAMTPPPSTRPPPGTCAAPHAHVPAQPWPWPQPPGPCRQRDRHARQRDRHAGAAEQQRPPRQPAHCRKPHHFCRRLRTCVHPRLPADLSLRPSSALGLYSAPCSRHGCAPAQTVGGSAEEEVEGWGGCCVLRGWQPRHPAQPHAVAACPKTAPSFPTHPPPPTCSFVTSSRASCAPSRPSRAATSTAPAQIQPPPAPSGTDGKGMPGVT